MAEEPQEPLEYEGECPHCGERDTVVIIDKHVIAHRLFRTPGGGVVGKNIDFGLQPYYMCTMCQRSFPTSVAEQQEYEICKKHAGTA